MRIKTTLILLSALFAAKNLRAADGDTFPAMMLEGVEITCKVISESDKTCQIGSGVEKHNVSVVVALTLPSEVNGYKVVKLADYAFAHWWGMYSIEIPEGVTSIGFRAFSGCSGLKSISLPSALSELGNPNYDNSQVFNGCYNLEEIKVAEGNTTYDSRNNCNAIIQEKQGITHLVYACKGTTIPEGVQIIDASAFCACGPAELYIPSTVEAIRSKYSSGLEKITVAEGNKTYDSRNDCNAIIETAKNELIWGCINTVIPDGVERLGDGAFERVYDLETINLPESVTSIGRNCFSGTDWLRNQPYGIVYLGKHAIGYKEDYDNPKTENSILDIKEGTEYISDNAFPGWPGSVVLPSTLKVIGNSAFTSIQMSEISMPENLVKIGEYAFEYCSALKTVNLNEKLEAIGRDAFYGCKNLTTINFPKGPIDMDYSAFGGTAWLNDQPDGVIYAGNHLLWYKGHANMPENTTVTIKEGTVSICNEAFFYTRTYWEAPLSNLVSVTLPNSIEYIGRAAFYGCTNLETVNIPEDVKLQCIKDYTFSECNNLSSIVLPNSLESIGQSAFSGTKLSNVTLPENLESIGDRAFSSCKVITLVIPEKVKHIGENAFTNCSGLEEITSLINEPFAIQDNVFQITYPQPTFSTAILNVPAGTKKLYSATDGWKNFSVIKEIGENTQKEDVTNDDKVDASDVIAVANIIATGKYEAKADVNEDGVVNVADMVRVANTILATEE